MPEPPDRAWLRQRLVEQTSQRPDGANANGDSATGSDSTGSDSTGSDSTGSDSIEAEATLAALAVCPAGADADRFEALWLAAELARERGRQAVALGLLATLDAALPAQGNGPLRRRALERAMELATGSGDQQAARHWQAKLEALTDRQADASGAMAMGTAGVSAAQRMTIQEAEETAPACASWEEALAEARRLHLDVVEDARPGFCLRQAPHCRLHWIEGISEAMRLWRGASARDLFVVTLPWWHGGARFKLVRMLMQAVNPSLRPDQFLILGNGEAEVSAAREQGFIHAVHCHHNAWLDEGLYQLWETPEQARPYALVIQSSQALWQRDRLASAVKDLAVIRSPGRPTDQRTIEAEGLRPAFSNTDWLSPQERVQVLNSSKVGGIFSAEEGGSWSTGEYLLCGLPVITTESVGGRDCWYTADNALVIEATAEACAAGVQQLVERCQRQPGLRQAIRDSHRSRGAGFRSAAHAALDGLLASRGVAWDARDLTTSCAIDRMMRWTPLEAQEQEQWQHAQAIRLQSLNSWDSVRDTAAALLESGDLNGAQTTIDAGLERFPHQVELLLTAGDIAGAQGDSQQALAHARELIQHHPNREEGWARAARELLNQGDVDAAEVLINEARERLSNAAMVLNVGLEIDLRRGRGTTVHPVALVALDDVSLETVRQGRLSATHGLSPDQPLQSRHDPPVSEAFQLGVCLEARVSDVYGIHDAEGHPFALGCLWWNGRNKAEDYPMGGPVRITPPPPEQCRRIRSALYAAALIPHPGHWVTENCSAIHPLLLWHQQAQSLAGLPIIVHRKFEKAVPRLRDLLNLDNEQILMPGLNSPPLIVDELIVPAPTFVIRSHVSKRHAAVARYLMERMIELEQPGINRDPVFGEKGGGVKKFEGVKLYLSRSRLPAQARHTFEEPELEQALEQRGWTIFHPQEHSLRQQLDLYENCRVICGMQGTAMHFLLGVRNTNPSVILLSSARRIDVINNPYTLQFEAQGIRHKKILCLTSYGNKKRAYRDLCLIPGLTVEALADQIDGLAA